MRGAPARHPGAPGGKRAEAGRVSHHAELHLQPAEQGHAHTSVQTRNICLVSLTVILRSFLLVLCINPDKLHQFKLILQFLSVSFNYRSCFFVLGAAGSSGDVCERANGNNGAASGGVKAAAEDDSPSTPKAISDLAARRARHRLLSGDADKHTTPSSRPLNKVIKSASATALSLMIPAGRCARH